MTSYSSLASPSGVLLLPTRGGSRQSSRTSKCAQHATWTQTLHAGSWSFQMVSQLVLVLVTMRSPRRNKTTAMEFAPPAGADTRRTSWASSPVRCRARSWCLQGVESKCPIARHSWLHLYQRTV